MALSLQYTSPFGGNNFTYFIVGEVKENRYYNHAVITLYGFIDAAARQAMAQYIPVNVGIDASAWVKDATISQIYTLIQATPEFMGAEDV